MNNNFLTSAANNELPFKARIGFYNDRNTDIYHHPITGEGGSVKKN